MALLVAFSSFAARAYALDAPADTTTNQQECARDDGWFDPAINACEYEAP
jgi:hypothetical protein